MKQGSRIYIWVCLWMTSIWAGSSVAIASGLLRRMKVWALRSLTAGVLIARTDSQAGIPGLLDSLSREYQVKIWNAESGLPHNNVRCLLQTPDGYLWIGTTAGLARFDGRTPFMLFDRANTPEMRSPNCVALAYDEQGTLWLGTDDGLLRWKDFRFTSFHSSPDGLAHSNVRYLSASPRGGVWIATSGGLNYYKDGKFHRYTTEHGLHANNVRVVFEDTFGFVWVGTEIGQYSGGVQRSRVDVVQFSDVPDVGTNLVFMAHTMAQSRGGTVWWGDNRGLHGFRDGTVRSYSLADGLSGEVVKFISPSHAGGLWLLTGERTEVRGRRGFHKFNGGIAARIDVASAGVQDDVICALEDREGSIWVGTRYDGLIQLLPRRIVAFTKRDGLFSEVVRSICADSDGNVWVGTDFLNQLRDGAVLSVPGEDPCSECPVSSVFVDRAGVLWLGKEMGHVHSYRNGQRVDLYNKIGADPGGGGPQTIFAMAEDGDGGLWVAHRDGVSRVQGEDHTFFPREKFFSGQMCGSILEDGTGRLWFGTFRGGIYWHQEGRFAHWNKSHGISSDNVLALFDDSQGTVWIGTDQGLTRFANGQFASITVRHGLPDNRINSILEDDFGFFWMGSNHGIHKVRRDELNAVADGRVETVRAVTFGEADGLPSSQTSSERQPVACKSRDGKLWFATAKGVVAIDPRAVEENTLPPLVRIRQVAANDRVIYGDPLTPRLESEVANMSSGGDGSSEIRLGPGKARVVEIHYTANTFVAPEKVRFQYRLVGHDSDWRPDDWNRRTAIYTRLSPGSYRFEVRACNSHGYWSDQLATFAFTLAPHFYETWPFYVFCGLLVIGAATGIQAYRLRVERRILALEQQSALSRERARIAQDMHDDLGANLTRIAILSEVAKRDLPDTHRAGQHVEQISSTARAVVDSMSELVWATNPKNDTLDNLIAYLREYSARYFEPIAIECRLRFPEVVPPRPVAAEFRRAVFLVLKEALHNVVKHSGSAVVEVGAETSSELPEQLRSARTAIGSELDPARRAVLPEESVRHDVLKIWVIDHGKGFDATGVRRFSNGLQNMRDRVAELGGRCEVTSRVGQGTRVLIEAKIAG